eukprot:SAG31_NODE_2389_length_5806_cov_3.020151_2_plen_69_part_00
MDCLDKRRVSSTLTKYLLNNIPLFIMNATLNAFALTVAGAMMKLTANAGRSEVWVPRRECLRMVGVDA